MAQPERVTTARHVIFTERTEATDTGVTTIYSAQATDLENARWESHDLDEVIEWTRGYLGAKMP